jgi:hypothetical protein
MKGASWKLKDLIYVFDEWINNKFDGLVVIDGNRGLGKSTVAIKLALMKGGFRIKRDVVFSREEVMKALSRNKGKVIVADEVIGALHNRDFFNTEQKELIKFLNMYRDNCNILLSCIPNFYDLDKQFRQLVKLRINVVRRGLAIIHIPKQSSFSADKWDFYNNEKIERTFTRSGTFKPRYSRLTTFGGYLSFKDLSEKKKQIYQNVKQIKRAKVFNIEDTNVENTDVEHKIITLVKENKLSKVDLEKYCVINGIKINTFLNRLNRIQKNKGEDNIPTIYKKQENVLKKKSISINDMI